MKQQYIDNLKALVDQGITPTRTNYRKHGSFSTYEIESQFGSFRQFMAAADLIPSSNQRALLAQVARHSDLDKMRELNIERADFGDKYRKPSGKRFQTIMVASDLHDKEMDNFWRRVFVDSVSRVQPDIICFGGDIFDLPEFGKYSVDPREWDVVGRIKVVHQLFADIREAAPDTELVLIEGNHEYRLLRHLTEASPAIKVLLSDLHGMTVSSLLGLDKYQVRYVARCDLGTWNKVSLQKELSKNYEVFHDTLLVDHYPTGINRGLSGMNGHHHKFEARSFYTHHHGAGMWFQLGSGHRRRATYCDGEQWNLGFAINHIDTEKQTVAMNYIPVSDFAEVGGKFYHRGEGEV